MGLIKTLLILFFFYYAFKFFARLLAPFLMKKVVNKMQQKAEQGFGNHQNKPSVKEGETVIDKKPHQQQRATEDVGDYVDFEEID